MTQDSPKAYYNEIDPDAVAALNQLISEGTIAPGDVDSRSIKDVKPDDLKPYTQVHFFAGGGLWSVAARLAGWPDSRPLWSGSCPCQGESLAGNRLGANDPRHLWPDFFRLIRARRPAVIVGEQVAAAAGTHWLDGTCADLESEDYAARAVDIPACAVDAPHIRQRLYWLAVANAESERRRRDEQERRSEGRTVNGWSDAPSAVRDGRNGSWYADWEWIACHDGKARRAKPGVPMLVDGMAGRSGLWSLAGNSISPLLAAEVLAAYLDAEAEQRIRLAAGVFA